MGIKDPYTAFCFDEACCLIISKLENKEEPIYIEDKIEQEKQRKNPKHYSSFEEFYKTNGFE